MKTNTNVLVRSIHIILIVMMLLTPIILAEEISKGLDNNFIFNVDIRRFKEYGMLLVGLLSIICSLTNRRNKVLNLIPLMLLALMPVILNSSQVPYNIILCGLRWIYPFFLAIFLNGIVDFNLMKNSYRALSIVFVIHLAIQIMELFMMPPYQGQTYFGLSARVPGIMSHSHAAAYFACLYYMFLLGFEKNVRLVNIGTVVIVISLLLAMSSTGVIVFVVLYLIKYNKKRTNWKKVLLFSPIFIVILFFSSDTITNRQDGSSQLSITARVGLLEKVQSSTTLISDHFGYATNGAFILYNQNKARIKTNLFADSFYISFLGNMGYLMSFILVIILVYLFIYLFSRNLIYPLMFLVLYSLFSVSNIVTEVYPGNLILSMVIAYFWNYTYREKVRIYMLPDKK